MPRGGSKKGERRGGRQSGTPNRATTEQALIAKQDIIKAVEDGRELAKAKLEKYMGICEGAAGRFKPTTPKGAKLIDGEDWGMFGEWLDRAIYCAKELAKYQSPTFKAIMTTPPPVENAAEKRKRFTLTIFEDGKPAKQITRKVG